MQARLPANELERLAALRAYNILDTLPEQEYQDIVNLASMICDVPIAVVSLVDHDRQWFKAIVGLDAQQTDRDVAFCAHALLQPENLLVVPDATKDPRFFDNPLVVGGPNIGFYAGAPLVTRAGLALGTLCVIDRVPRELTEVQRNALSALSRQVMSQLERRHELALLQETQAQLLQSEKMASIGQLAAGVAHEINNPIGYVSSNMSSLHNYAATLFGVIDGYQKILDTQAISAEAKEAIHALRDSAELDFLRNDMQDLVRESAEGLNRVRDIVLALKDFSHVDINEWQLADLHHGIDSTLKIAANEIKYKARIEKQYGDIPQVNCVLSQLNQVFLNLLTNAAHAIDSNGVITIRTSAANGWVTVQLSDNGSGIAPADLPHLFEPFFTTKPIGLGTGLGLSVSYNIVKKHGGHIDVESVLGKGTTFTVALPVVPPASAPTGDAVV